jgi:outer membrane protein assembly factor BamD (BamD/ComL family)
LLLCALAGCRTGIDASALKEKDDEQIRQMAKTDDVHGPLERIMRAAGWNKGDKKRQLVNPPEAMTAYHAAEDLLAQKKYKPATEKFWAVAEKYKDYPVREDAAFMCGEAFYLQEIYPKAQDKYDVVIKEFSATRHLDEISRRKFEMARIWLGFPEIVKPTDVQPVNFEKPSATPLPEMNYKEPTGLTYAVPVFPNFTEKRRPMFDTQGRALEALKSIWLNDPTGPLADDALMLSASYYLRKGDYTEADHLYDLLIKEFGKSPHLENAYILDAHAKLMSYQGPEYDDTELEAARKLKLATLRLFPNRPDKDRIKDDLAKIEQAKAARIWADVVYWQKKGKPKAVAIYCVKVIKAYPNSAYSQLAREALAKIAPKDKDVQFNDLAAPNSTPNALPTTPQKKHNRKRKNYEDAAPDKPSVGQEPNAFAPPGGAKQVPQSANAPGQSDW